MRSKLQSLSYLATGLLAGILLSVTLSSVAQRAIEHLPIEELRAFADIFNAVQQGYVEPVSDQDLINHAISGMLSGLDPHSAYLDEEAFKEIQEGTQGEFGGLGIEIGMEDGFVKVISPIENTPAFRAGIQSGDLIVKLDDKPVKGMTQTEAVKIMRGTPGTKITLTIMRKDVSKPIIRTITREIIKVQSVRSKIIEPGYAYIRIANFQENTLASLVEALNKHGNNKPLKGMVLDLRNDPGGLLHSAIGVSAAFLPPGTPIVSTRGRLPDSRRNYRATPANYLRGGGSDILQKLPPFARKIKMVVLVNAGSASASEIVAGALQDHKRAKVIGTRTFGKGSVQTILSISENTAIKLTTARYYTPSGRSIQATGIEPDIEVPDSEAGSYDRIREVDLIGHLSNKKTPEVPHEDNDDTVAPPDKVIELGGADDYQLQQAMRVLKGQKILPVKKKTAKNDAAKNDAAQNSAAKADPAAKP